LSPRTLRRGRRGSIVRAGPCEGEDGVRVAPPTGEDSRYWVQPLYPPGWGKGARGDSEGRQHKSRRLRQCEVARMVGCPEILRGKRVGEGWKGTSVARL